MGNCQRPGPTHDYPEGKLRPDDGGGLNVALGVDRARGVIYINFAVPVSWIAAGPDVIRDFARQLNLMADKAEGKAP